MPSAAAASFDDAFGSPAPARKTPSRKSRAGKKASKKKSRSFSSSRTARYVAIAMGATIAGGTVVNALMMQKGHHPAPLFGKVTSQTVTVPAATRVAAANARPAAELKASEPAKSVSNGNPPPAAPVKAVRLPHGMGQDADGDAIARLLQGSAVEPSSEKSEAKTVLAAQKALAKLGFAVKASGTFGPATRKAVQAFEKDRRLPVKGDLSHRVVKVLAAESGIKIE